MGGHYTLHNTASPAAHGVSSGKYGYGWMKEHVTTDFLCKDTDFP